MTILGSDQHSMLPWEIRKTRHGVELWSVAGRIAYMEGAMAQANAEHIVNTVNRIWTGAALRRLLADVEAQP